jgi:cytidylate kinase
MKITIDGPAASGKSTIGAALAARLGYLYFDTGVMYRAVTVAVLQRHINILDEAAVSALAQAVNIEVAPPHLQDGRQYTVLLEGQDVTWALRGADVDANVSIPSAYAQVREAMVRQQRRIAERGNVVMVGRDIGTVVLPDADLKIYLDASVEDRARRRHTELIKRGQSSDYADVLAAMRQRDLLDSSRATSPLRPAPDAIIVDSTGKSIEDVLSELERIIAAGWPSIASAMRHAPAVGSAPER